MGVSIQVLHTLIGDGPKLCMQQPWFPLEPGSSFGVDTQCLSCLTGNTVDVFTPVEVICEIIPKYFAEETFSKT